MIDFLFETKVGKILFVTAFVGFIAFGIKFFIPMPWWSITAGGFTYILLVTIFDKNIKRWI